MELVLRNGEKINLDWNPIILEYLEEYEGGIEKLREDIESQNSKFRAFNYIIYCVISTIYPEELSYSAAVSLVNINDLDKIVNFIVENVNNMQLNFEQTNNVAQSKNRPHRR